MWSSNDEKNNVHPTTKNVLTGSYRSELAFRMLCRRWMIRRMSGGRVVFSRMGRYAGAYIFGEDSSFGDVDERLAVGKL